MTVTNRPVDLVNELFSPVDSWIARIERLEEVVTNNHNFVRGDAIGGMIERIVRVDVAAQLESALDRSLGEAKAELERDLKKFVEEEVSAGLEQAETDGTFVTSGEIEDFVSKGDMEKHVSETIKDEVAEAVRDNLEESEVTEAVVEAAMRHHQKMTNKYDAQMQAWTDGIALAEKVAATANHAASQAWKVHNRLNDMTFFERLRWLFTGKMHGDK